MTSYQIDDAISCYLLQLAFLEIEKSYTIQYPSIFKPLFSPLKCYKEGEVKIIIRKSKGFVKHGQNVVKNRNFIPKWGVNDHKTCHVKFSLLAPKGVI